MSDAQLKAGTALCAKLLKDYSMTEKDIKVHKDLAATACPGKNFRFMELIVLQNRTNSTNEKIYYTVQVGAFENIKNAKNLLQKLAKQGYSNAFIKSIDML